MPQHQYSKSQVEKNDSDHPLTGRSESSHEISTNSTVQNFHGGEEVNLPVFQRRTKKYKQQLRYLWFLQVQ